jgi:hypothetical protein
VSAAPSVEVAPEPVFEDSILGIIRLSTEETRDSILSVAEV